MIITTRENEKAGKAERGSRPGSSHWEADTVASTCQGREWGRTIWGRALWARAGAEAKAQDEMRSWGCDGGCRGGSLEGTGGNKKKILSCACALGSLLPLTVGMKSLCSYSRPACPSCWWGQRSSSPLSPAFPSQPHHFSLHKHFCNSAHLHTTLHPFRSTPLRGRGWTWAGSWTGKFNQTDVKTLKVPQFLLSFE